MFIASSPNAGLGVGGRARVAIGTTGLPLVGSRLEFEGHFVRHGLSLFSLSLLLFILLP